MLKCSIRFIFLFIVVVLFSFGSCQKKDNLPDSNENTGGTANNSGNQSNNDSTNQSDSGFIGIDSLDFPKDLMLIYNGDGQTGNQWKKDKFRPYVYKEEDGQIRWLFDGFLFLNLKIKIDGVTYNFAQNYNKPANKNAWQELLNNTFQGNRAIGGLNQLMEELTQEGFHPPYRRKVIIAIPFPYPKNYTWGWVGYDLMDFTKSEDRIKAAKWYIDQVLNLWEKKNYKHLQLAGFNWIRERVESDKKDPEVVREVSNYVHDKGFDFYWIPYRYAAGAGDWKDFGFDIAYQQPNYFFKLDRPYSLLTSTIDFANEHDMTFEMEFNDKLLDQPDFLQRFYDYIFEYKKAGVWEHDPVAYYADRETWLKMSKSKSSEVQIAFDSLCNILIKRSTRDIYFK